MLEKSMRHLQMLRKRLTDGLNLKAEVEGEDKPVTFVTLTDEGKAFVQAEDAE